MISVNEALTTLEQNTFKLQGFITIPVVDALGYVLAEDVISPINMPPFKQSAVDGYALCLHNNLDYNLKGEVKAGDNYHPILNAGEAIRIFTGAPVPETANAVIMQEKVIATEEVLHLKEAVNQNQNIRPLGEQTKKGAIALTAGTRLTSAGIAFLISLGITEIKCYEKPSIAIVVTGNELVSAGQPLNYGQIYESNSTMLFSALKSLGYINATIYKVVDNYQDTVDTLQNAISKNDVILVSGGISVGDYDFVGSALKELQVEQFFYKVKQKPGKPLFFGKKENKYVFALPGNPAAAISCFYVYVYPTLQRLSGNTNFEITRVKAKSTLTYTKKGERAQFLKATYNDGKVTILEGQNSSMLHTFAIANALTYIPEDLYDVNIDDPLEVIILPIN